MQKNMIKAAWIVLCLAIVLMISGCGTSNTDSEISEVSKPAVAITIANTANADPVDSSAPLLQETLHDCVLNYGTAFVIRTDGKPEVSYSTSFELEERFKEASKEWRERYAQGELSEFLNILNETKAINPEVDFLEALRYAANSLNSLDDSYTSRTIICCGSGLGTAGYVDFSNNLLSAEPAEIVEALQEREALPDLSGISSVYWIGMSQVKAPQDELSPKQSKQLEDIWNAIIEASGSKLVLNSYVAVADNSEEAEEELPPVTVVNLPADDEPIKFDNVDTEKSNTNTLQEAVILDESKVKFMADTADYLYPEQALENIRPIAEHLIQHQDVQVLAVGSTAGDVTNEATIQLSQERADRVAKSLVELGVDGERVIAIGMGASAPWHIPNIGDGEEGAENRNVVLLDTNSAAAQSILEQMK